MCVARNIKHELQRKLIAEREVRDMCARYDDECGKVATYHLNQKELDKAENQYDLNKIIEEKKHEC